MLNLTFRSLSEQRPGSAWRSVFNHGWPGWREWFLRRGGGDRPALDLAHRMLRRHMPEFEPVWQRLLETVDSDDDAARFLTFWQPPRYLVNCSQMVVIDQDGPALVRNYDLDPKLNEARILKTRWKHHQVIGMVEGMAGLADGMNAAGLAISLAFGGRAVSGPGFGIPLLLRYVLEICSDLPQALAALRAVPCHMAYNVTMADRSGAQATVMLAPDHPPFVSDKCFATNHQLGVEWPRHGRLTQTVERAAFLDQLASEQGVTTDNVSDQFLSPPLHSRRYAEGFGTVYTSVYRPVPGRVELRWPGHIPWCFGFDDFPGDRRHVAYEDQPDIQLETETGLSLVAAYRRRNQVVEERSWVNLNGAAPKRKKGRRP